MFVLCWGMLQPRWDRRRSSSSEVGGQIRNAFDRVWADFDRFRHQNRRRMANVGSNSANFAEHVHGIEQDKPRIDQIGPELDQNLKESDCPKSGHVLHGFGQP